MKEIEIEKEQKTVTRDDFSQDTPLEEQYKTGYSIK